MKLEFDAMETVRDYILEKRPEGGSVVKVVHLPTTA
jgi:hypothetical protein